MLVPITDPENPYSTMMLELIADQTPFPQSALPRRQTDILDATSARRQRASAVAVVTAFVVLAIAITGGVIRAFES